MNSNQSAENAAQSSMAKHYFFALSLLLAAALPAQQPCRAYTCALERAEAALTGKRFQEAFNYLESAEGYPDARMEAIRALRKRLFAAVEQEKVEAQRAKAQTQKTLKQLAMEQERTGAALAKADSALQKSNKLIKAFYFYDGRFAVAYADGGSTESFFYFIDKNGKEVNKLGRWQNVEQFDWRGFAKGYNMSDFLLDTFGNIYGVAYDINNLSQREQALDLTNKGLDTLPSQVWNRTQLEILWLGGNALDTLPSEIGQLKNLTRLNLHGNKLTALPPEIGQLKNLMRLNLYGNQLTALPPEIGHLDSLIELDLSRNQLTALPPEIGHLDSLIELDLSSNRLTALPPEIGQLKNLKTLDLSFDSLTALPPEIGQLDRLIELNLGRNRLTALPPEIGQLDSLIELHLSSNRLTSLPPEIGQLKNLKTLDLSFDSLTALPPEIGQLDNLIELYLSNNRLTSLPPEIGQLKNLTRLNLDFNYELKSLPPEIGQLKSLKKLKLFRTQLTSLPLEVGLLDSLIELDLRENDLRRITQTEIRRLLPNCRIEFSAPLEDLRDGLTAKAEDEERRLLKGYFKGTKTDLANIYTNLAWYQLLTEQFFEAERSVRRGLELDSSLSFLHSNLTSALLLQDDPAKEAEALLRYNELKDKECYPPLYPKYRDAFLSSFKVFELARVIPASRRGAVARARALLGEK